MGDQRRVRGSPRDLPDQGNVDYVQDDGDEMVGQRVQAERVVHDVVRHEEEWTIGEEAQRLEVAEVERLSHVCGEGHRVGGTQEEEVVRLEPVVEDRRVEGETGCENDAQNEPG